MATAFLLMNTKLNEIPCPRLIVVFLHSMCNRVSKAMNRPVHGQNINTESASHKTEMALGKPSSNGITAAVPRSSKLDCFTKSRLALKPFPFIRA